MFYLDAHVTRAHMDIYLLNLYLMLCSLLLTTENNAVAKNPNTIQVRSLLNGESGLRLLRLLELGLDIRAANQKPRNQYLGANHDLVDDGSIGKI